MADRAKQLARIHRVRTVQLTMVRSEEARARDRFDSEAALHARIGALADAVAPVAEQGSAAAFSAAAHYRERLHQSAVQADARLRAAGGVVERAAEATRAARRDQSAIEKLIARAEVDAALREIRALEEAPPARGNRHDPC